MPIVEIGTPDGTAPVNVTVILEEVAETSVGTSGGVEGGTPPDADVVIATDDSELRVIPLGPVTADLT
jgi:hypothetical protein